MFKTTAVPIIFVACAVLAGASTSKAQQFTTQKPRLSEGAWHNHGWGFAGPGVYNEKDPSKRKRLAGLLHMAHVHAVAQLCADVELIHANIAQLFAGEGFEASLPLKRQSACLSNRHRLVSVTTAPARLSITSAAAAS